MRSEEPPRKNGAKFMLTEVVHIGVGVSLLVIVGVMSAAIVASLLRGREDASAG